MTSSDIKYAKRVHAFTEQGVAMLSSVLRSERAIEVNIAIMRAFVQLREMLASNVELARKLRQMEKKYDEQLKVVFEAIRQLMAPPETMNKKIGFEVKEKGATYGRRGAKPKKAGKKPAKKMAGPDSGIYATLRQAQNP